jgi:UDP-N-acetylglucosamine 2-epimerase (non-hydrolysing)
VVLGTRPEVVKLAHVIRGLGDAALVIHSGQHYDDSLSKAFFDTFGLADPDATLDIGGTSRGAQIGEATRGLDRLLAEMEPRAVVVQGDTNTALAGALAANSREVPLVHVEAGLRSFDRRMPEEHNRVIADHLADLCCAPTAVNVDNLRREGISDARVTRTGNTVVEAVTELLPPPEVRAEVLSDFEIDHNGFALVTLHRPENVDSPERLSSILAQLRSVECRVVYPMHPRTAATVERFGLSLDGLEVTEPLDYITFLALAAESALLVSDSGGIQEEASIIKRPVAVVRRSTERPEVQGTFAELVEAGPAIGRVVGDWLSDLEAVHARIAELPSPYGDGTAAARTVAAMSAMLA